MVRVRLAMFPLAMVAAVLKYGAAFRLTVGSFVAQLFGAAATAWA